MHHTAHPAPRSAAPFFPRRTLSATVACLACFVAECAHAGPEDALNYFVGASVVHDDNLFRLPSQTAAPTVQGTSAKSDTLTTLQAGIRYDRAVSLQRFQLDLTAVQYNYRTHDYLNFSALNYRGAWLWSVSPRLTGTLSADRTTVLESYATLQDTSQRNKRTTDNQHLTADWQVDGGWHLLGGAHHLRSEANAANTVTGNYTEDTAEGGLRYVSAANNSVALVHRATKGSFFDRTQDATTMLDTGYNQSETEAQVIYRTGAHSQLDGRVAYRDRSYDHYSTRDYAGTVWTLGYLWTPTEKLRFTLAAGRDLVAYQEQANSYYATRFINLTPSWQVTEKTAVRMKLGHAKNDYRGAIVATSPMREDTVRNAELGLSWRPTQTVLVDTYVAHERRSSNIATLPYRDNLIGLSASGTF